MKKDWPELSITKAEGSCPLQIEGYVQSRKFYFRARHETWSFQWNGANGREYEIDGRLFVPGVANPTSHMNTETGIALVLECAQWMSSVEKGTKKE